MINDSFKFDDSINLSQEAADYAMELKKAERAKVVLIVKLFHNQGLYVCHLTYNIKYITGLGPREKITFQQLDNF